MERKTNRRGYTFHSAEYRHLKLRDLKTEAQDLAHRYHLVPAYKRWYQYLVDHKLMKDNMLDDETVNRFYIPPYPRPEFHVTRLKHDTNREGLKGIRTEEGFKNPFEYQEVLERIKNRFKNQEELKGIKFRFDTPLLWWSLSVGPDEVASAERRLLETTYPDRTEEQVQMQESFLHKFASSPAFSNSSMFGSYRFTLSLEEVLKAYRDQFCGGAEPVIRVLRTDLYKQEVMYAVVVHGPDHQDLYGHLPLLTDGPDSVCAYRDGHFLWRSEAMCKTHRYQLVRRDDEKQMGAEPCKGRPQFYVWDNVGIALHVDNKVLKFDVDRLRESLTFCDEAKRITEKEIPFDSYEEAEELVREQWPDYPSALKRDDEVRNVDKDRDGDEDDDKDGDGDDEDVISLR